MRTWRSICLVAAFSLLIAGSAMASTLFGQKVSATQTNTNVALGFNPSSITIYNSGANEVFVALDAAATTSSVEIPSGSTLTLTDITATSLGVICSTGETATVYVYAARP